jgi:hypothetical protein
VWFVPDDFLEFETKRYLYCAEPERDELGTVTWQIYDTVLDGATLATPPTGEAKSDFVRRLVNSALPVALFQARYVTMEVWHRSFVIIFMLGAAAAAFFATKSSGLVLAIGAAVLAIASFFLISRATIPLFDRLAHWEARRSLGRYPWWAAIATIAPGVALGTGAVWVGRASTSSADVLLIALGIGALAQGVGETVSMFVHRWIHNSGWPPKDQDAVPFATYILLYFIHVLKRHSEFDVQQVANALMAAGVWLSRWLERTAPRYDELVHEQTLQLAWRVRGTFAAESLQLLRQGRSAAATTLAFCSRASSLVLDRRWDDLVSGAYDALRPSSSIGPVVREIARGVMPLAIAVPFVVLRTPPTSVFSGILVFAVLWALVTLLRLADPAFRDKLADVRSLREVLKR